MTKNIGVFAATVLAIVAFAIVPSTAMAQSYSGNWPIAEHIVYPSGPPFSGNPTYCLTLTDNGTFGFPHSGLAILNGSGFTNFQGIFQVANNLLIATFYIPDDNGSLNGLVFVGPATKGNIGKGFGELVSGAVTVTGTSVFGPKGGCGKSEQSR
jgi:hypothetical protein